jgi:hypothetical protein
MRLTRLPLKAWAILERDGSFYVLDGRVPVFWLRGVAVDFALEHGLTTRGPGADCRVERVTVRQP